jgi:CSLREA domain-containing protein
VLALAAALPIASAGPAEARTITVTTFADQLNGAAPCSLREAVIAANLYTASGGCPAGESGVDTIVLRAGRYELNRSGTDDDATNGGLDLVDEDGVDALDGGPGSDLCVGGPGADSAVRCERRQTI